MKSLINQFKELNYNRLICVNGGYSSSSGGSYSSETHSGTTSKGYSFSGVTNIPVGFIQDIPSTSSSSSSSGTVVTLRDNRFPGCYRPYPRNFIRFNLSSASTYKRTSSGLF